MNRLLFVFLLILLVAIRKRDFANISRAPVEEPEHEEPRIVDGFEASDNSFRYQVSLAKNNAHYCG